MEVLVHESLGGKLEIQNTAFGMMIRGKRDSGEIRTSFCENQHEYDFEYGRSLRWLLGEDVEL